MEGRVKDSMSKSELVNDAIKAKYDISLKKWVSIRLRQGKSWRQIADELNAALGWSGRPMTYSGLHRWWMRNS
jgi:hypothetical protein